MSRLRDELHDEETDLADPGPLGEFLRLCRDHLVVPFRHADQEAIRNQARHRWITGTAALLGGASLVLAAVNISFPPFMEEGGILIEAFFSVIATALVLIGIVRSWHGDWLLKRYQAEQLRLAKFRFLVDPDFWCEGAASAPGPRDRFLREIERIEAVQEEDLKSVAADEGIPALPSGSACGGVPEPLRLEILTYYRRKRLAAQTDYFSATGRRKRRWYQSPALLPMVFFASVLCVALHAGAHLLAHGSRAAMETSGESRHAKTAPATATAASEKKTTTPPHSSPVETFAGFMLAASLALPGGWAAVRTWRTANEFGRNRSRSLARFHSLSKIADRLRADSEATDVFSDLGLAEHILAGDQGEWLRLMLEAEWYG